MRFFPQEQIRVIVVHARTPKIEIGIYPAVTHHGQNVPIR